MNRPKFQENGKTVVRKRVSVLLHPELYRLLNKAAGKGYNKSDFIATLLANYLKWKLKEK